MKRENLAVLGLGLIGGSIAASARAREAVSSVIGWDPNPEACAIALARGYVDAIELTLGDAVANASLVVAACPVPQVVSLLREVVTEAHPGTLLTDVASTKLSIFEGMQIEMPEGVEYLGSHPLAGSEKSGPSHADANLLENRVVAICPGPNTKAETVGRLEKFWQSLGARVVSSPAERHDILLSLTSHLPHLLAYLLAAMPNREHSPYLAGGFRDMTRLAGSSPHLWMGIFQDNRTELLARAMDFRSKLDEAIASLEQTGDVGGVLKKQMEEGWKMRTSWQAL